MAVPSIQECSPTYLPTRSLKQVPILLCLPEADRPGRLLGLDETLLQEIEERLQVRFGPQSAVFAEGRIGGVRAIERASQLLAEGATACVVAGVDSILVGL